MLLLQLLHLEKLLLESQLLGSHLLLLQETVRGRNEPDNPREGSECACACFKTHRHLPPQLGGGLHVKV